MQAVLRRPVPSQEPVATQNVMRGIDPLTPNFVSFYIVPLVPARCDHSSLSNRVQKPRLFGLPYNLSDISAPERLVEEELLILGLNPSVGPSKSWTATLGTGSFL